MGGPPAGRMGGGRMSRFSGTVRELAVYPRLLTRLYPLVRRELDGWAQVARDIPDPGLRLQALASIEKKRFHCVGGAVLALGDRARLPGLVRAIVAIQTISDYLDNLCDRAPAAAKWYAGSAGGAAVEGYAALMRLHEAVMCAVDPDRPAPRYYDLYLPYRQPQAPGRSPDGGYLGKLVAASREVLKSLPGYCNGPAKSTASRLACLYSELQSIKHLPPHVRDAWMERWFQTRYKQAPSQEAAGFLAQPCPELDPAKWLGRDLEWWEFGAATGSTLAIFALICGGGYSSPPAPAPARPDHTRVASAYFPAICGLHILLDYYIDQDEDLAGGDLNFVFHYSSPAEAAGALTGFARWAIASANACGENAWLHRAVVRGLLAMYLSDPKVDAAPNPDVDLTVQSLLDAAGGPAAFLRRSCARLRKSLSF